MSSILEKIKKLLRLGRSSNQHEAELAMQRAFELAQRHHVDVESLELDERTAAIIHEYLKTGSRISFLKKRVLGIVQTYFHVTCCICRDDGNVAFIGKPTDVTIALYVFDFLVAECTRCRLEWEKEEKQLRRRITENKRKSFVHGFIYGVARALSDARNAMNLTDAQSALVVAEEAERDRYMATQIGKTTKSKTALPDRKHRSALNAGYDSGQATQINKPLNPSSATLALT